VKDSFSVLDLAQLGFRELFRAEWIWRSDSLPISEAGPADVLWRTVETAVDLAAWEAAWSPESDTGASAHQERVFLPALLSDPNIAVIAAYQSDRIVAGAIANRAADCVGLSNVFVPARHPRIFWAGCVAAVIEVFPDQPIAGYEAGHALAAAKSLGFAALEPLRIWVRAQPALPK
jgi:hypothetical protein